jgi:uncharacterized membrane protein
MKLKLLIGVLLFLIVLNLATIGTFVVIHFMRAPEPDRFGKWGPRGKHPMGEQHPLGELSSEERKQLRGLLMELFTETSDLRDRVQELEGEALELLKQDPVPRAQVDSLLGEISEVRVQAVTRAVDKLIEAKSFLTPEQQEMFYQAILRAGHGGPPGRRGPFRDGPPDGRRRPPDRSGKRI